MTVAQARTELTGSNFEVAVDGAQSSQTIDPGSVISTQPADGAEATVGSTVHIIPSSGVNMPNVLNFPQDERGRRAHGTPGSIRRRSRPRAAASRPAT